MTAPLTLAPSLLIIGTGSLGQRVGNLWLAQGGDAEVLAETRSTDRHGQLRVQGMATRLRSDSEPPPRPFVLLSVPPSAQEDYTAEARRAVQSWDGRGRLVMTSSTAVYAESTGGSCSELSPLANSERALRLIAAERPILDAGGMVIRLAGLYDRERGPHRVFLRMATSPRRPDGLLNLIHYDDAASLCLAAFERGERRGVYLGCDEQPIRRAELVAMAADSAVYAADATRCRFEGSTGPVGRRCENRATRGQLGWSPSHASFGRWLLTAAASALAPVAAPSSSS